MEQPCVEKAQILANSCSAVTNRVRVSPSRRLWLLRQNCCIIMDGAGQIVTSVHLVFYAGITKLPVWIVMCCIHPTMMHVHL